MLSAAAGGAVAEIFFVANSARGRRGLAAGWFLVSFLLRRESFYALSFTLIFTYHILTPY